MLKFYIVWYKESGLKKNRTYFSEEGVLNQIEGYIVILNSDVE